ncbi:MAG: hypothetical protein U0168_05810 [Nannocystaceae bacterium]
MSTRFQSSWYANWAPSVGSSIETVGATVSGTVGPNTSNSSWYEFCCELPQNIEWIWLHTPKLGFRSVSDTIWLQTSR